MQSPNPPAALTASSAGRVQNSLACVQCGYDLRTLPLDGACPECNRRVAESAPIALATLTAAAAGRLRRAAWMLGLTVLAAAGLAGGILFGWAYLFGRAMVGLAVVFACAIGAFSAHFIGTARNVSRARLSRQMRGLLASALVLAVAPALLHHEVWLVGCLVPAFVLCNTFAAALMVRQLGRLWHRRSLMGFGSLAAAVSIVALFALCLGMALEGARLHPRLSPYLGSVWGIQMHQIVLAVPTLLMLVGVTFPLAMFALVGALRDRSRAAGE